MPVNMTSYALVFNDYRGAIPDVLWPLLQEYAQTESRMPIIDPTIIRVVEQFRSIPLMAYDNTCDLIDKLAATPDRLYFAEKYNDKYYRYTRYRGIARIDLAWGQPAPADIYIYRWDPNHVHMNIIRDYHGARLHPETVFPVEGMPGLYHPLHIL